MVFFIKNTLKGGVNLKKQWRKPNLEALEVKMTMKGWKPFCPPGKGGGTPGGGNGNENHDDNNDIPDLGLDS